MTTQVLLTAGVNLTIRGVMIPVFAPNITATALQGLINTALKNGINPTAQLGVEVIPNPAAAALTYRLLTNRTAFVDDLSPSDIVAELVVLPELQPAPPATNGPSAPSSSSNDPGYCLQRSNKPKNVTYTNADGTTGTIVVHEEVWENVTVAGSSNSDSSSGDASVTVDATALSDETPPAVEDKLSGISISVSEPLEPPPVGGQAQGLWQIMLEGRSEVWKT